MKTIKERVLVEAVSNYNTNVTAFQTIDAIKDAGFKNVFIQWFNNNEWNPTQEEQLARIKEYNLNVIFAHLAYREINDIWVAGEKGDEVIDGYMRDTEVCKKNEIPMVVMHLTDREEAPMYSDIGLERLKKLADYAESIDMKIAFENTKIKGYVDYVIENIRNENVGICFDVGHYHAHFKDDWDLSKFKDRVFAVHLHDNDGMEDQHLLPFDGTLDWKKVISDLKSVNYSGPITMESCYRNDYLNLSVKEFYKKSYEVAKKIQVMFD